MEDACNLCNVIEIFYLKKITNKKKGRPFSPFKLQMALAQLCKNTSTCLCRHPNISTGRIDQQGVDYDNSILWRESHWKQQIFRWCKIEEVNLHVVGSAMTTSTKVIMLFLMNTMSTC